MSSREQESLLQQFVDGSLAEAECERVIELLKSDPEAFESYCEYAELDAGLNYLSSGSARFAEGHRSLNLPDGDRGGLRRTRLVAVLSAAAAVLVATCVLYFTLVPEPEPVLAFRSAPESRLQITHSNTGKEAPEPGTLEPGSRLLLDQGSVELNFASGVRAVVDAPADLTLVTESHLQLVEGRGFFEVPPAAIGFAVHTPELVVTDLGTEFAVHATVHAGDQVHVIKGRVEALNLNGLRNREILNAGDAREAGPAGRLNPLPLRAGDFSRTLPGGLPYLHWSFDGDNPLKPEGTVPGAAGITARTEGNSPVPSPPRRIPGARGMALSFQGQSQQITTNWPGLTGRTPRTFACWVKPDPGQPDSWQPIVEWGASSDVTGRANAYWRVRTILDPATKRCVLRVAYGRNWIDGSVQLADGDWHHVAISESRDLDADGFPKVRFFVDGEEDTATRRNHEVAFPVETRPGVPLSIGWTADDRGLRWTVDELFLVEGELPRDAIRKLMAAGDPSK